MKSIKAGLGIVFYKNKIAVSEVRNGAPDGMRQRTAEFVLGPEQADLGDLSSQAAPFKSFLNAHGFTLKKAIVGIDAGRVFTTCLNIPPAGDPQLNDEIIRLQLERKTQWDMEQTVFAYSSAGGKMFVCTVLRRHIAQIRSLLVSAGIRPVCITACSLMMARHADKPTALCILEYPDSAEWVALSGGHITALRSIPDAGGITELLPRVRRQMERHGWVQHVESAHCTLLLSRSSARDAGAMARDLFAQSDVHILTADTRCELAQTYARMTAQYALEGKLPPLNLLRSIQPHRSSIRFSRWVPRIAVAALIAMLLVVLLVIEWRLDRRRIADCRQQIQSLSENVKSAEAIIEQTAYARQWFVRRPLYLDMLKELTRCFPEQGGIWLNSLAVDESLNQVITGKASGERAVLDVVDNLKSSPLFREVKILYIRQAGKNTREETFAIRFRCEQEK